MKYLLLQYLDMNIMMNLPKEEAGKTHAAYMAYTEAMKKAGVFVDNHGLRPASEATTVRAPGGKQSVVNDFSLRERGIPSNRLAEGVKPAPISIVIDQLAEGRKAIWH
ncbi:MAG: YciI family protein [Burkholderiales bacterium]